MKRLTSLEKKVVDKYLASIKVRLRRTRVPKVIALVGLIGSGKEEVARVLAKELGASLIDADAVRLALRKNGLGFDKVREITYTICQHILRESGNAVIKSDFIELEKRRELQRMAGTLKGKVYFVRTVADRDVMISRLIRKKYKNVYWVGGAAVMIREMWRRTPWHYQWSKKGGGQWILKRLPFRLLAEIDTTDSRQAKKEITKVARQLRR